MTRDPRNRRGDLLRRATAGALVVLALATLASLGYAGARKLGVLAYGYGYQYCTTPSQYQYCSTSTFVSTVTLSAAPVDPVTVSYKTADGTAKTGQFVTNPDYVPTSGTLTFPAGTSTKTITVSVLGDKLKEPNESFFVNLSNLSPNAYFGDSQEIGTIQNDD